MKDQINTMEEFFKYFSEVEKNDMLNKIEAAKRDAILKQTNIKIWQGKNGRWCAHLPDKEKKRKLLSKRTKEEVENAIIEYVKKADNRKCFSDVYQEWISEKERFGELSASSLTRYRNDYIRFFDAKEEFCKMNISDVNDDMLEEFVKRTIHDKALSRKSYAGLKTILNGVFKYARRKKYTLYNIEDFWQTVQLHKNLFNHIEREKEEEVFTIQELSAILKYVEKNSTVKTLAIALQIYTGMRVGELAALKVEDIELEKNCIHVHRTEYNYFEKESGKRITEVKDIPKTENSDRHIILSDEAVQLIKQLVLESDNNNYLFTENGKRITSKQINYELKKICRAIQILPRSTHKIRRAYASNLLNKNADMVLVQSQMGHKDISTTQKYYYYDILPNEQKLNTINSIMSFKIKGEE